MAWAGPATVTVVSADRQLDEGRRQVVAHVSPIEARMRHEDHDAREGERQQAHCRDPVGDPDPAGVTVRAEFLLAENVPMRRALACACFRVARERGASRSPPSTCLRLVANSKGPWRMQTSLAHARHSSALACRRRCTPAVRCRGRMLHRQRLDTPMVVVPKVDRLSLRRGHRNAVLTSTRTREAVSRVSFSAAARSVEDWPEWIAAPEPASRRP